MRRFLTALCLSGFIAINCHAGTVRYRRFNGDIQARVHVDNYVRDQMEPLRAQLLHAGRPESASFLRSMDAIDNTILTLKKDLDKAPKMEEAALLAKINAAAKEREELIAKGFRDYLTSQNIKFTGAGDALNIEFPQTWARTAEAGLAAGGDHGPGKDNSSSRPLTYAKLTKSQTEARDNFIAQAEARLTPALSPDLSAEGRKTVMKLMRGALTTYAEDRLSKSKRLNDNAAFLDELVKITRERIRSDADAELIANAIVGNADPAKGADLMRELDKYFDVTDPARKARVLGGVTALYGLRKKLAEAVAANKIPEGKVGEFMGEWIGLGDKFRSWLYKTENGKQVLDPEKLAQWTHENVNSIQDLDIRKLVADARRTKVYPEDALCRTIKNCTKGQIVCQAA